MPYECQINLKCSARRSDLNWACAKWSKLDTVSGASLVKIFAIGSHTTTRWFGAIVPGILNLLGMMGYNILNAILCGQTLSVVSGGRLSWNVGIVIIRYVGECMRVRGADWDVV
jgi:hypothetical protein